MSEELVTIEGKTRDQIGKNYCRKLRAEGKIPANLMEKSKSTLIEIDPKHLSKAWKGDKTFNLLLNGQSKLVRIQELQINPVKRTPLHVDLMYV